MVEAFKFAFARRALLGDPKFEDVSEVCVPCTFVSWFLVLDGRLQMVVIVLKCRSLKVLGTGRESCVSESWSQR